MLNISVRVCIALKRHNDQGSSYKVKYSIEASLQFRALIPYHNGWWHAGRHDTGKGAENSIS